MLCAKLGWNWLCGSGEEENVISLQADGQIIRKANNLSARLIINETSKCIIYIYIMINTFQMDY